MKILNCVPLIVGIFLIAEASFATGANSASAPAQFKAETNVIELGSYCDVLEDPKGDLTLPKCDDPDVSKKFTPSRTSTPGFGYSKSTFWMRWSVENSTGTQRDLYLEIAYPHLDRFTLFIIRSDGTTITKHGGRLYPFTEREV